MAAEGRTRTYQVLQTASLFIVSFVCYVLLMILYLSPAAYNIPSLVFPDVDAVIQPSAVVGILATALAGATSALVTRAVEHSFWITLWDGPKEQQDNSSKTKPGLPSWLTGRSAPLTVGEVHRLAGWSTSPWDRLLYIFGDPRHRSLPLYIAGPSLLATAGLVGPLLLLGISQSSVTETIINNINHTANPWQTRLTLPPDVNLSAYTTDNPPLDSAIFPMGDYLTELASLAAMNNETAKPAPEPCSGVLALHNRDKKYLRSCQLKARTLHIRAECTATDLPNSDGLRVIPAHGNRTAYICAEGARTDQLYWANVCAKLGRPDDGTEARNLVYSNFQTGFPQCPVGMDMPACSHFLTSGENWAYILGLWVKGAVGETVKSDHRLQRVDCRLQFGNVTITQVDSSPPILHGSEFTGAEAGSSLTDTAGELEAAVIMLRSLYASRIGTSGTTTTGGGYDMAGSSPYAWAEVESRDRTEPGANVGREYRRGTLAALLLGYNASRDAETVARQIEKNFEMATLHAFVRNVSSSDLETQAAVEIPVWVYDSRFLWVLLLPLVATGMGTWGRWRIAGVERTVGYDPVRIARLGPVEGADGDAEGAAGVKGDRDGGGPCHVWLWKKDILNLDGRVESTGNFVVHQRAGDAEGTGSKGIYSRSEGSSRYRVLSTDSLVLDREDGADRRPDLRDAGGNLNGGGSSDLVYRSPSSSTVTGG